ncbi:MAG: hypothetical protein Fur0044_51770 [Anaerolineae bacterium]
MVWEVGRYFHYDFIGRYYVEPRFHFTYEFFPFVAPLPGQGMYWLFGAMGLFALGLALGFYTRWSALLFFLSYTYVFLLDKTPYNNHYYLISLLSFLLIWVDAQRWLSLDRWRKRISSSQTIPFWQLFILRAQFFIVYFYGGLAKLNRDWLMGEPVRLWLAERTHYPFLGPFFDTETAVYFFSYGGLLFDLAIGFLLLWRPTRLLAFGGLLFFHLMNNWLFSIGIFPFLALAATILFVEPEWPRGILSRLSRSNFRGVRHAHMPNGAARGRAGSSNLDLLRPQSFYQPIPASPLTQPARLNIWTLSFIGLYLALQLLIPLRHWLYPGEVSWTEEGHRFAWHMKLRDKEARLELKVIDPRTGQIWNANLAEDLTADQIEKMGIRPDMILQYTHYLREKLIQTGLDNPIIIANAWASLNGRPFQQLIDPRVNLAQVQPDLFAPSPWILPLTTELPRPVQPVLPGLTLIILALANLGLALTIYLIVSPKTVTTQAHVISSDEGARNPQGATVKSKALGISPSGRNDMPEQLPKTNLLVRLNRFNHSDEVTPSIALSPAQVIELAKVMANLLPYLGILLALASWAMTGQPVYLGVALLAALLAAVWGFIWAVHFDSAASLVWLSPFVGILAGLFSLMLLIVSVPV